MKQKQAGFAGSRRFTPAQQAVATALMEVMKRAIEDCSEAAHVARLTLLSNNTATQPLLNLIADSGPLPTTQHVEQTASVKVFDSLTTLARQCKAAQCQPLEVFSRSVQCTTRKAILDGMIADRAGYARQCEALQQRITLPPTVCPEDFQALQELGIKPTLAAPVVIFVHIRNLVASVDGGSTPLAQSFFSHMLPGRLSISSYGEFFGLLLRQLALSRPPSK